MKLPSLCGALVLACLLAPGAVFADTVSEVRQLMRQGDLGTALQRAEAAVVLQPMSADLRFLQGLILIDQQSDAAAFEVFTRLAQDFPELPEAQNNLAYLHARAGRWEAARAALETALRLNPAQRAARENLGDVHLQLALQAWAAAGLTAAATQRKLRTGGELLALPANPAVSGLAGVPVGPNR